MVVKSLLRFFLKKPPQAKGDVPAFASRPPRIPKESVHQISFEFEGFPKQGYGIANISVGGLGFYATRPASDKELWPKALTVIPATITIGSVDHKVGFKLVYTGPKSAGGMFVEPPREMILALQKHLHAELAGGAMSHIGPDMLNPEKDGAPHWFQGDNAELFLVEKDLKIVRFNLACFGNYMEVEDGKVPRFGKIIDAHDYSKPSYKSSSEVHWSATVEPATLEMFIRMAKNVPGLRPELRAELLRILMDAQKSA